MVQLTFEADAQHNYQEVFKSPEMASLIAHYWAKFPEAVHVQGTRFVPLSDTPVAITSKVSMSATSARMVYTIRLTGDTMAPLLKLLNDVKTHICKSVDDLHYFDCEPAPSLPTYPGHLPEEHRMQELSNAPPRLKFNATKFHTFKNFTNVYGAAPRKAFDRIEFFMSNEEWYRQKGVPYQLGFLFTGMPGGGKTSTIKAIASHTCRHIVNVSFPHIKTLAQLKNLFHEAELEVVPNCKEIIPTHKRLYVLEDIDACGALLRRSELPQLPHVIEPSEHVPLEGPPEEMDLNASPIDWAPPPLPGELTLADVLNLLDGGREAPGRLLIMTSNHPEALDPALLRPGRVDGIIEFANADAALITDMYKGFFGCPPEFAVPDTKRHSPAQVSQYMLNSVNNPGFDLAASLT